MPKDVEISCRVTKEQKDLVKRKAKANKMMLSEYIRYATLSIDTIETEIITKITCK
jgi:uncharacterized protein (DUF1778 family)